MSLNRYLSFLLILLFYFLFTSYDFLNDNDYYNKAIETIEKAVAEYEKGNYDKGFELSEEAKKLIIKAKQINTVFVLKKKLEVKRETAGDKLEALYINNGETDENTKQIFKEAVEIFEEADEIYEQANSLNDYTEIENLYNSSIEKFNDVINKAGNAMIALDVNKDRQNALNQLETAYRKRSEILKDNIIKENDEYDKNINKMLNESQNLYNDNEFITSINKSNEAINYMEVLINQLNEIVLSSQKQNVRSLYEKAYAKLIDVKKYADDRMNRRKINKSEKHLDDAYELYENEDYIEAVNIIGLANQILNNIDYGIVFPRYYKVRLTPNERECLWSIAELDFVYNDGKKWVILYEKNKKRFGAPNNPDLIYPKKLIEIPSINGETRKGLYNPNKNYPVFNPNKDYSK